MSRVTIVTGVLVLFLGVQPRTNVCFALQDRGQAGAAGPSPHEVLRAKSVDELIENLQEDPTWLTVIQQLRLRDDRKAVEPLKTAFDLVETKWERQIIASALVSLGESDMHYFEYIAAPAREAAESEIPFPIFVDESGKLELRELGADFVTWCEARELNPAQTSYAALYETPLDLMVLTMARDTRATDIFLRALESPNFFIVNQGITGLALMGQEASIAAIVRALERMPAELRQRPAAALMLFDVPDARELARQFVPDETRLLTWAESYRQLVPQRQPEPEN